MIVLILHPTEVFKITGLQKKLCHEINPLLSQKKLFPEFPLWFTIPEELMLQGGMNQDDFADGIPESQLKSNLKKLSSTMEEIVLDFDFNDENDTKGEKIGPFRNNDSELLQKKSFANSDEPLNQKFPKIRMKIKSGGKFFVSEIPFFTKYETFTPAEVRTTCDFLKNRCPEEILQSFSEFPAEIKIFRIGKAIKLSEKSRALESSVWKKIR